MDRKKLLWVDLEMTGIEPEYDVITEIAVVVTDYNFNELDRYEAAIKHPSELVQPLFDANSFFDQNSDDFKQLREAMDNGKSEEQVITEVGQLIDRNFKGLALLAGNSIHQDRRFIRKWWPEIDAKLHYRMLDVTSFKIIMEHKYNLSVAKSEKHRALEDIYESIHELKVYLEHYKR